jgi:hypothetical protein
MVIMGLKFHPVKLIVTRQFYAPLPPPPLHIYIYRDLELFDVLWRTNYPLNQPSYYIYRALEETLQFDSRLEGKGYFQHLAKKLQLGHLAPHSVTGIPQHTWYLRVNCNC